MHQPDASPLLSFQVVCFLPLLHSVTLVIWAKDCLLLVLEAVMLKFMLAKFLLVVTIMVVLVVHRVDQVLLLVLMVEEGLRWLWGQTSGLIMVPGPLPSTGQPSICQSTHQPIPQILLNTHPYTFHYSHK